MQSLADRAILIVEDDRVTAQLLERTLRASGAVTQIAGSVDEAEAALKVFHAQVILLDLVLPGFNGLELVRRLRAHSSRHQPIIVAVTGWLGSDAEATVRGAGCHAYLPKPVQPRVLIQLLAALLSVTTR
jgi:DNA-binding response OmpR family regulator